MEIIESVVFLILLKDTTATMVLKKDGRKRKKVLRWKILGYNGAIPIHVNVIIDENHQKVTVRKLHYIPHKNQFVFRSFLGELICVLC